MSLRNRQQYLNLPIIGSHNDHEEKPSHWIRSSYILLLFGFYILLFLVTKAIEDDLPSVVRERDIAKHDSNTFSEETANKYLNRILGDQPRVSGTKYHLRKTMELKNLLDEIASNANSPVVTDWQFVSGDYWLAFSSPHVNCYQNVSNIIAVLEGDSGFNSDGSTKSSILVNCHYDSVPFAIGASDNGVFCAAMVETLSKLSRRRKKLKHNIVFLFNGAEEGVLMGSHGFLRHPWARGVASVVNLDSAGMNGKPSVFQVTDPRVLEVYKKISTKPNAQGLGEALFASGAIPSDTDFRIFRDFGDIHGIDMAFIKGGNVYHTRNDRPELIDPGVLQNAGDILLPLLRDLADTQDLETKKPPSTLIYFDYLGLFLVTYSKETGLILDLFVGFLGLTSVFYYLWMFGLSRSSAEELMWAAGGRVLCVLTGGVVVTLLAWFMVLASAQMRYLSAPWMLVPLYLAPYLLTLVYVSHLFDSWRVGKRSLQRSIRVSQALTATRLLLSCLLLLLSCFPALANVRYVISVPLVLMALASFPAIALVRYGRLKAWQHLVLEVMLTVPGVAWGASMGMRLLPLLVPLAGRSGASRPDLLLAGATALIGTLGFAPVAGAELLFSRRRSALLLCASGTLSVVLALAAGPYGAALQRHYWFHTQITTYNANFTPTERVSGVLITKLDVYSVRSALEAIKASPLYSESSPLPSDSTMETTSHENLTITDDDLHVVSPRACQDNLYCDLPLYRPRFDKFK